MSSLFTSAAIVAALLLLPISASAADAPRKAPADPALVELQRAYESATREAKAGDSLDNAYELLSLADTAQQYKATQIASGAGTAFADLVRRATAGALKPGAAAVHDTLDQFVDLRSAAYSVPAAQTALDDGLRELFPAVAGGVERKLTAAATFEEKLAVTGEFAMLQSSAIQVKMPGAAKDLGSAFDGAIAALRQSLESEADTDARVRHATALDDALKARDEHLKDAAANTIDIIAQRMRTSPGEGPSGRPKD